MGGFVVPSKKLLKGWDYFSITEDVEFATDSVFNGEPIRFCNDAALLFPLFFGLQLPLDIAALFKRNVTWVKIPLGDK